MYYVETYTATKKESKELISKLHTYFHQYNSQFLFNRIYRRKLTISTEEKSQLWNVLVMMKAADGKQYEHFQNIFKDYQTQLIRQENMLPTPGSFLPSNEKNGFIHIVEYVHVQPDYLAEFKEIMIHNNGPAMEHIIQSKKWCKEFIALETAEVLFHKADYPAWNQIHLIAMLPSGVFHFKKDFNEGLIKVNAPNFAENFERLGQIRKFTSKVSAAREL